MSFLATKPEFLFGMDGMLVALAAVSVAISSPHPSPHPRAILFQAFTWGEELRLVRPSVIAGFSAMARSG